jgi:hypothetical protein
MSCWRITGHGLFYNGTTVCVCVYVCVCMCAFSCLSLCSSGDTVYLVRVRMYGCVHTCPLKLCCACIAIRCHCICFSIEPSPLRYLRPYRHDLALHSRKYLQSSCRNLKSMRR